MNIAHNFYPIYVGAYESYDLKLSCKTKSHVEILFKRDMGRRRGRGLISIMQELGGEGGNYNSKRTPQILSYNCKRS